MDWDEGKEGNSNFNHESWSTVFKKLYKFIYLLQLCLRTRIQIKKSVTIHYLSRFFAFEFSNLEF